MKHRATLTLLASLITALALVASISALVPGEGKAHVFTSLHGQTVTLHGRGLYASDSTAVAAQGMGQDLVTLALAVPLLLISLIMTRRGSVRGRLLFTGALGYFLYTYASYAFLSMYNQLFLVYVALMSASFFAFTLCIMSFDMHALAAQFGESVPVKLVGGLLIGSISVLGMMWLKLILTPLIGGGVPPELEHYTTLVIQALDLGFVIPVTILAGVLLIRRRPLGYLLATVMAIKESALLAAITAMMVVQSAAGVPVPAAVVLAFAGFDLLIPACLVLLMRGFREPATASNPSS